MKITWFCNEKYQGKGPTDGIGGTLKKFAYHPVMSGKCVIDILKQFVEHAEKAVKVITSLHLPAEDVLLEPGDIEASPRIKDT